MFENEVSAQQENKQKEQLQYLVIALLVGVGYYLFFFLPNERKETKKEVEEVFRENSPVIADDLDASLWKGFNSWQERLDKFYLPSQIRKFSEDMIEEIEVKKKELEEKKFRSIKEAKESAIKELENYCSEEEKVIPEFKKVIEKYSQKINKSDGNNISALQKEANELIVEERVKRQGLHWRRKIKKGEESWVDRELLKFKDAFEGAWKEKEKRGMKKLNINAPYAINFPPSLWNELSEEQKNHEKAKELKLDPKVDSYKFNDKINEWYDKVELDPVRGERDPNNAQKDNNALLYGTGGTGKSITVEKLAYKSDKYPLVVIQGSALTPKLPDQQCSVAVFEKFIYTIADINWTLIDDFDFRRDEGGEVRYILFVDEADQISENSFAKESTGLTFLKECMGSDDYKNNESWNLWIMATNHLDKVDPAAYRPGRLSNPLDFSWTLGDFMKYADENNITSQFPERWLNENTLDDEDNKWVNRFNTMFFENEFLPFWDKFIASNPNAEYEPEKDEENNDEGKMQNDDEEKKPKKIKIKWGEMFEFFWRLKDSSQLDHFNGKFINPRQPKIEQIVETHLTLSANQISRSIDIRLKEIAQTAETIKNNSREDINNCTSAIESGLESIRLLIAEVGKKNINNIWIEKLKYN